MKKVMLMMKKIKFNWGTGLIIAMIIFMAISLGTTILFMNQEVELVTDDYYEKTLVYQDQIDLEKRTVDNNKSVEIKNGNGIVQFIFPEEAAKNFVNGNIYFYRPASSKKDFTIPVNLDENGEQIINGKNLDKGLWRISVRWNLKSEEYFSEKSIIIQ